MSPRNFKRAAILACVAACMVMPGTHAIAGKSKKKEEPLPPFVYPRPDMTEPRGSTNGSIVNVNTYVGLSNGSRAGQVGDILTIDLVENMQASKSNSAKIGKSGSIGILPPVTGPLSFVTGSDLNIGSNQSFNGGGQAAQTNQLTGQISVVVMEVYGNGVMLVRGEKLVTLNRGDERVEFYGLVRRADIGPGNRVPSSRVTGARIRYYGEGEIANGSKQGWLSRFFASINPF